MSFDNCTRWSNCHRHRTYDSCITQNVPWCPFQSTLPSGITILNFTSIPQSRPFFDFTKIESHRVRLKFFLYLGTIYPNFYMCLLFSSLPSFSSFSSCCPCSSLDTVWPGTGAWPRFLPQGSAFAHSAGKARLPLGTVVLARCLLGSWVLYQRKLSTVT